MPTTSRGPAGRTHPSGPRLSSRPRRAGVGRAAAPTPDPPQPAAPRAGPSPSPQPSTASTSLTTRAAVLLGVLAILAASYALPVRAWLDQRSQLAELSAQRDALAAEVEQLREANALWQDPAYVRAQARERLNYVLPGEVGLVVLGTESTAPGEPAAGAVLPAAEQDQPWWSTLLSAFTEVGMADQVQGSSTDDGP